MFLLQIGGFDRLEGYSIFAGQIADFYLIKQTLVGFYPFQ